MRDLIFEIACPTTRSDFDLLYPLCTRPSKPASNRLSSPRFVAPFWSFLCSSKCDNKLDSDVRNERHFRFRVFSCIYFPFFWTASFMDMVRILWCVCCMLQLFLRQYTTNCVKISFDLIVLWVYLSICLCLQFFSNLTLGFFLLLHPCKALQKVDNILII